MNVETIETMSHLVNSTEKSTSPTEGRNLSCWKKTNKQETVRDRGRVHARKRGLGWEEKPFCRVIILTSLFYDLSLVRSSWNRIRIN